MFMEIDAIALIDEVPTSGEPLIWPERDEEIKDDAEYVLVEIERRSGGTSRVFMTHDTYVDFTEAYMSAHGSRSIESHP